ncbi:MAG: MFS transporter [Lentisphaerae bacterium]|nr:MFS transporter [Lentisphaerota bacterium]
MPFYCYIKTKVTSLKNKRTVPIMIHSAPDNIIYRKKFAILLCGVLLYFLSCMAKVLIPGTIYDDLLNAGLNAEMISDTAAAFMYAYAASQLLAGIFSTRYGGVRILLTGGALFAIGTTGFPLTEMFPLMIIFRIAAGFGAGTIFLGVVKLLEDLFPAKFAMALGIVMFCSYFGPAFGTTPMVLLTGAIGWRNSMMAPGIAASLGVILILLLCKSTIKPVAKGNALKPLADMLKNRAMWLVSFSASLIFGAYYILTTQIGQKSLIDHCNLSAGYASMIIMGLTLLVAANNITGNVLFSLLGKRKKVMAFISFLSTAAGAATGFFAFCFTDSTMLVTLSFILIAIPAGFFPFFGAVAKELNPPEDTGLSVALLNFWCFVFIAAFQSIGGKILHHYSTGDVESYPPEAYCGIFIFLTISGVTGMISALFYPASSGKQ